MLKMNPCLKHFFITLDLLPSLLPNTTGGREECSNMWYTYLERVFIFLKGLMGVIIKTEVRKMLFGH